MSLIISLKNRSTGFHIKHVKVFFIFILLAFGFSSSGQSISDHSPKSMAQMYCGSCHIAPSPNDLPRRVWKKTVLPEMGSYYGVKTDGFGLLKKMKPEELQAIKSLKIYPETQRQVETFGDTGCRR